MTRRARWLLSLSGAAVFSAGVLVVTGLREAVADPEIRRLEVAVPDWPADQRPLVIALIADIHLGNRAMDVHRLNAAIDEVNGSHPDLVLIAGDFVAGHDRQEGSERAAALQKPLSRLGAPLGVIAVLGNHDHWTAPQAVTDALTRAGIILLTNRAIRVGPLGIVGVDDAFSGHDDVASAIRSWKGLGGIPIVLTHSPDLANRLDSHIPLVLAGHTHCGQVVVPWLGPLVTRSPLEHWRRLYEPRYRCGVVREGDRTVVVTAGLGSGTTPIRLGAPPDWWLIRVGSAGGAGASRT